MDQQDRNEQQQTAEIADERAVRSIPLDTGDGGTFVIEQQNVGPINQMGGGALDPDAPGRAVIADEFGEDAVEPNEPA